LNQKENTTTGMKWAILDSASIKLSMPKTGCFVTSKSNMVFAAQKRRLHPKLDNSTVIIVVNHVDLDPQITGDLSEQDRDDLANISASNNAQSIGFERHPETSPWLIPTPASIYSGSPTYFMATLRSALLKFSIAFRVADGQPV
jgi:hypothetical protein